MEQQSLLMCYVEWALMIAHKGVIFAVGGFVVGFLVGRGGKLLEGIKRKLRAV